MTDRDEDESRRILAGVERDSGGGLLGTRLNAPPTMDRPDSDWIEVWGTRIGRAIGIAVAAALMAWIVLYALNLI